MKQVITAVFLIICIGILGAADLESYEFIDTLLNLRGPAAPVVYDDAVIFTAPSSWRRVGISFAYEDFSRVYWLKQLLYPRDPAEITGRRNVSPYQDSGMLFHVQIIPENIGDLDYRMVIDGLWTTDPMNPVTVAGTGGIYNSRVSMPARLRAPLPDASPGLLSFTFYAPPGEKITVGGNFNNWDPFMYEMKETGNGIYSLYLALPPGTYQYVFFHRGERHLDPVNPDRIYTKDGKPASQAQIR